MCSRWKQKNTTTKMKRYYGLPGWEFRTHTYQRLFEMKCCKCVVYNVYEIEIVTLTLTYQFFEPILHKKFDCNISQRMKDSSNIEIQPFIQPYTLDTLIHTHTSIYNWIYPKRICFCSNSKCILWLNFVSCIS